ncbi:MAG: carboxylating nicotinate-nucleotide diphosphorylase [Kofleriaceae bacterium]
MALVPLPTLLVEPIVRAALLEDLGRAGDITTDAIVPTDARAKVALAVREAGVVAGLDLALLAFRLVEPTVVASVLRPDGSRVAPGDVIATLEGPARGLLTAERVALNFMCHMSGIATATAGVVETVRGTKARVIDIRKTLPGLRAIQKYAVRAGGGVNHRFGLDDGILIKDNHIAVAGGIRAALERARAAAGHMVKIEIEVDTLEQLAEVMTFPIDAVLLDNMSPETLRRAIGIVDGRAITEASGGITPTNAGAIAATGVDLLSMGWLTQSVRALDIGVDYV